MIGATELTEYYYCLGDIFDCSVSYSLPTHKTVTRNSVCHCWKLKLEGVVDIEEVKVSFKVYFVLTVFFFKFSCAFMVIVMLVNNFVKLMSKRRGNEDVKCVN